MSAIQRAREAAADAIRERSAHAASRYSNLTHNEELARFDRARSVETLQRLLRNHNMHPHIYTRPSRNNISVYNRSYRPAHGKRRRRRGTRRR